MTKNIQKREWQISSSWSSTVLQKFPTMRWQTLIILFLKINCASEFLNNKMIDSYDKYPLFEVRMCFGNFRQWDDRHSLSHSQSSTVLQNFLIMRQHVFMIILSSIIDRTSEYSNYKMTMSRDNRSSNVLQNFLIMRWQALMINILSSKLDRFSKFPNHKRTSSHDNRSSTVLQNDNCLIFENRQYSISPQSWDYLFSWCHFVIQNWLNFKPL